MPKDVHILKKPNFFPKEPSWDKSNIYVPISINNRLLRDVDFIKEMLGWIFKRADRCDAIIGDYLHRHNVMLNGATEEKAIKESALLGKEIVRLLHLAAKEYPDKTLKICPTQDFYFRKDFQKKLSYYDSLYKTNKPFCEEIQFLIHQFLERQGHIEGNKDQLDHCKYYLLEELVIFEMLAKENYLINIYPGKQLKVFKNIVEGLLPNISKELEKVTLIELRVKPSSIKKVIQNILDNKK